MVTVTSHQHALHVPVVVDLFNVSVRMRWRRQKDVHGDAMIPMELGVDRCI